MVNTGMPPRPIDPDVIEDELGTEFFEVIEDMIRIGVGSIEVAMPGAIHEYDDQRQLAKVQPLLRIRKIDGTPVKMPVIPNVPVIWTGNTGGLLKRKDFVQLVFGTRDFKDWLMRGGFDVTPQSKARFGWMWPVAFPGLRPVTDPLQGPTATRWWAGEDPSRSENPRRVEINESGPMRVGDDDRGLVLGDGFTGVRLENRPDVEGEAQPDVSVGVTSEGKVKIGTDVADLLADTVEFLELLSDPANPLLQAGGTPVTLTANALVLEKFSNLKTRISGLVDTD